MSSDIAIKVENLRKCYQIFDCPRDRLKQFILPRLAKFVSRQPKRYFREFWALDNASFQVSKGETVGIVGRNGSGKSTLLQIICGTLFPTSGNISVQGRMAALLELGSGFNPEFTGRENVYMNAAILGLSRGQIESCFDDVLAFAEIGDFIDQPVKKYSSGMVVRLAFSVAIHTSPDILVVDEALAVGDFQFQAKCYQRIGRLKKQGVTILLVSHDLSAISQFCDRAVLLSKGELICIGSPQSVINEYKRIATEVSAAGELSGNSQPNDLKSPPAAERRARWQDHYLLSERFHSSGNQDVEIVDWGICSANENQPASTIAFGAECLVKVTVRCRRNGVSPNIGFFFSDVRGNEISGAATTHEGLVVGPMKAGGTVEASFGFRMSLKPGSYFFNLGCSELGPDGLNSYHRLYCVTEITICGAKDVIGFFHLSPRVKITELFDHENA